MKQLLIFFLCVITSAMTYADDLSSLTLSPAEMQKLKKYFPTESETSHLAWKGDPVTVQLPVGQEKRVVFPAAVLVDVKGALNTDQLHMLNNDKSVYLTAVKPFEKTRIYVTLQESGKVILVDLVTNENIPNATQYIDIKESAPPAQTNQSTVATTQAVSLDATVEQVSETESSTDVSYVDLVRFAWQQVYAPKRLLKDTPHYARVPMHTETFISDLIYGDKVIAHPTSSWVAGDHYVTAIAVQNKYPHATQIDVRRDLCGEWEAATIYPSPLLKPQGNHQGDSATLLLVSQKPFSETLEVCHGNA